MQRSIVGLSLFALLSVASLAHAQQAPQSKEPLLVQLFEDVSRARQNAEIELASCKVQVKDLQQQIPAAPEKKEKK